MEHTAQQLKDILSNLDSHITVDEDSSYSVASFDHDDLHEAWVTVETDWADEYDDEADSDDEVTVYHAQNSYIGEKFMTLAEAIQWLKDDIEDILLGLVSEIEAEEKLFEATTDDFFVIARSLWQGDTWKVIAKASDKAQAEQIATDNAHDGWSKPVWSEAHQAWWASTQNLKNVVNTCVVTKAEMVNDYGIKLSDALEGIA